MQHSPLLGLLLAHPVAAAAVILALTGVTSYIADSDWQWLTWGGRIMFGQHPDFFAPAGHFGAPAAGGLHVYGNYPIVQVGPPVLLLARLLWPTPDHGAVAAMALNQMLGLVVIVAAVRVARRVGASRVAVLVAAVAFVPMWTSVGHYGHLDDALALAAVATAMWCMEDRRWLVAGLLLGLGAACKPWAVAVVPIVLVAPTWRHRLGSAVAAGAVIAAAWGPFVMADTRTLHLGSEGVEFSRASALAAFGVHALPHPGPVRLAQFIGGMVLAAALVWGGRWRAVPLAVFAFRLAIDPMSYPYYVAALAVGALFLDSAKVRMPVITAVTLLVSAGANTATQTSAVIHAVLFLGLLVVACAARGTKRKPPDLSTREGALRSGGEGLPSVDGAVPLLGG